MKDYFGGDDPAGLMELTLKTASGFTGLKWFEKQAEKYDLEGKVYTPLAKLSGNIYRKALILQAVTAAATPVLSKTEAGVTVKTAPSLIEKVFGGLIDKHPFIGSFIANGATRAGFFFTDAAIDEVASYGNKDRILTSSNLWGSIKHLGSEAAFSLMTGGLAGTTELAIAGLDIKVPVTMLSRGTWLKYRSLRDDNKTTPAEWINLILLSGIDGYLSYAHGAKQFGLDPRIQSAYENHLNGLNKADINSIQKSGMTTLMQTIDPKWKQMETIKRIDALRKIKEIMLILNEIVNSGLQI